MCDSCVPCVLLNKAGLALEKQNKINPLVMFFMGYLKYLCFIVNTELLITFQHIGIK